MPETNGTASAGEDQGAYFILHVMSNFISSFPLIFFAASIEKENMHGLFGRPFVAGGKSGALVLVL